VSKVKDTQEHRLWIHYLKVIFWATTVFMTLAVIAVYFWQSSIERKMLDREYELVEEILVTSNGDIYDVMNLSKDRLFHVRFLSEPPPGLPGYYKTPAYEDGDCGSLLEYLGLDDESWTGYGNYNQCKWHLLIRRGMVPGHDISIEYVIDVSGSPSDRMILMRIWGIFVVLSLILGDPIAKGFAKRAVFPINEITEHARRITAQSLSERLPVPNPQDATGRLATEFNQVLDRLERSFGQLRQFSDDIAHELRTPLAAIRANSEIALRDSEPGSPGTESLSDILEGVDYIQRILDNLLQLSRGESGRVELSMVPVDAGALIQDVSSDLRVLAEEKGQVLGVSAGEGLTVHADEVTLRQALNNVVHNALRYTPEGGEVKVEVADCADGSSVVIRVLDTGPGIPEDERTMVFDRFYRLEKSRSKDLGGTGLGLAIAKWAVEANDGSIRFTDLDGWGGCCEITLPRQEKP